MCGMCRSQANTLAQIEYKSYSHHGHSMPAESERRRDEIYVIMIKLRSDICNPRGGKGRQNSYTRKSKKKGCSSSRVFRWRLLSWAMFGQVEKYSEIIYEYLSAETYRYVRGNIFNPSNIIFSVPPTSWSAKGVAGREILTWCQIFFQ